MYFKYGSFQHDDNEVELVNFSHQRMYSPRNRLVFTRYTLTCQGHLCVSGQDSIKTKIKAFENAYKVDGRDAALYHDDGTKSAHHMPSASSINGVRVKRVLYPTAAGGEYATGRSYLVELEADYLNPEDTIYSFSESLAFTGAGGPAWELVPQFSGAPIAYVNFEKTPQHIVQSGEAIGLQGWPLLPSALFPLNYEHTDLRFVEPGSSLKIGVNADYLFPIRYRYYFSLITPTSAYPRQDYPGR